MFKMGIDLGTPAFKLPALDHLMSLKADCSDADVRTVLGAFGPEDLRRLDAAFDGGLVVRRVFHAGGGRGCLLYHLNNAIISFGAQSHYFAKDAETFRASQALVAAWDSDTLSEERVRALVIEAVRAREQPGKVRDPWAASFADVELPEPHHESPNRPTAHGERRPSERSKGDNRVRPTAAAGVL